MPRHSKNLRLTQEQCDLYMTKQGGIQKADRALLLNELGLPLDTQIELVEYTSMNTLSSVFEGPLLKFTWNDKTEEE